MQIKGIYCGEALELLKIYLDAKVGPGSTVIRIAATRHVEAIIMMTYCGDKAENEV